MNKKKKRKGFTLVELVVVIAILGILATIAIPRFSESRKSAAVAAHNANVRVIKSVVVMYLADNPSETGATDIASKLDDRFDGGAMPKPNFNATGGAVGSTDKFAVTIENGDIKVVPGEMKISDEAATKGNVVPVNTTTP